MLIFKEHVNVGDLITNHRLQWDTLKYTNPVKQKKPFKISSFRKEYAAIPKTR